jgi:hypothetical protein
VCTSNKKTELMYDFSIHANNMWYCDSVTNLQTDKVKALNIKLYNKLMMQK